MTKTLFDAIKKTYRINVRCKNCGEFSELSIPKGVSIESYLASEIGVCQNCGVASLEKYIYPASPQFKPTDKK